MHEMSIAQGLMDQVLRIAQENNLSIVEEVEIETGYLKQVIPQIIQQAFQAVSQETIARGAILKILEISAMGQCNQCQEKFKPELDNFLCPRCLRADVRILQGDDIILKTIIGKQEETHEN